MDRQSRRRLERQLQHLPSLSGGHCLVSRLYVDEIQLWEKMLLLTCPCRFVVEAHMHTWHVGQDRPSSTAPCSHYLLLWSPCHDTARGAVREPACDVHVCNQHGSPAMRLGRSGKLGICQPLASQAHVHETLGPHRATNRKYRVKFFSSRCFPGSLLLPMR